MKTTDVMLIITLTLRAEMALQVKRMKWLSLYNTYRDPSGYQRSVDDAGCAARELSRAKRSTASWLPQALTRRTVYLVLQYFVILNDFFTSFVACATKVNRPLCSRAINYEYA